MTFETSYISCLDRWSQDRLLQESSPIFIIYKPQQGPKRDRNQWLSWKNREVQRRAPPLNFYRKDLTETLFWSFARTGTALASNPEKKIVEDYFVPKTMAKRLPITPNDRPILLHGIFLDIHGKAAILACWSFFVTIFKKYWQTKTFCGAVKLRHGRHAAYYITLRLKCLSLLNSVLRILWMELLTLTNPYTSIFITSVDDILNWRQSNEIKCELQFGTILTENINCCNLWPVGKYRKFVLTRDSKF